MSYLEDMTQYEIGHDGKEFEIGDLLDLNYCGMRYCEKRKDTNYARQLLDERNYPLKVEAISDIGYYYLISPTGWSFWCRKTSCFDKIDDKDRLKHNADDLIKLLP